MQAQNDDTPRLISLNDVCEITSLSRTAINRFRANGEFPEEVSLGERRVAFVRSEVHAWMQMRIDARKRGARYKLPSGANDNSSREVAA
ncbi:AlpA family phage regulatory protein [Pelagibacterium flavum]|uniref:AlpA family phage regulatory protein n=1 Tax=Pelagibacterium flavum TaxID=2984530 RepID=A0ABY6IN24_9HYPH|nr:AlpA family phage regulatory protein [Pelagibacterium sp. YIM 151497]UYQ70665.1 AlpA family phage regulatory protein [Pelagibacterium sp. YIM 151497]